MNNKNVGLNIRNNAKKWSDRLAENRHLFEGYTREDFREGQYQQYGVDVPFHYGKHGYQVPLTVLWQIENELWEKNRFKWRYFKSIGLKIAVVAFLVGSAISVWVTLKLLSLGII